MTRVSPETFEYQLKQIESQSDEQYAKTKFEIVLDWLRGSAPLRVLNVGCGAGELSLMLARAGHRVVGIDLEPEFVALASQAAVREELTACRFEVSALEEYQSDEPFDVVAATDVIEHIEDDGAAMAKIASLVKPGGRVIIAVPAGQWLFGFHDRALGHYRRYSAGTLRSLVEPYCRVEALRYYGMSLIPVALLYSRLLQRPYPVAAASERGGRPLVAATLRAILGFERRWPMPLGTSVLLCGRRF